MVLFVLMYLPILITYAMANYFYYGKGIACRNVPRVVFAGLEFFTTLVFSLISFVTLQSVEQQEQWGLVVSDSYMSRYTRPMVVVNILYAFSAITNLCVRVWTFWVVSDDNSSCSSVLGQSEAWVVDTYPIYMIISLIIPPWSLFWYFFITVVQQRAISFSNGGFNEVQQLGVNLEEPNKKISLNFRTGGERSTSGSGSFGPKFETYMDARLSPFNE
eukprot:TRINITY_DN4542_c0_g1_i1.p1 TRINITY_DN4542_c0_g1~~TRINITY_DN4542_c0_g1_i1.p1  ORF type:complete len:217 (+),score=24.40 TRINITY_DN4542_c0_g1_i1:983-1633(+)